MKIILVSVLALALMLVFAACGASKAPLPSSQEAATPPASGEQPQSGLPQASGEEPPAEPEALEDPDGAMIDAHSDVQGDMETHNSWYDEENELLLSYPNVFEPIGERDADGYMRFKSLQTEGVELVYWVTPNTYGYTPSEFIASASYNDMLELEGNAVIGRFDDLYQETGEVVPTAYYWVVDIEWIVNVAIYCDTPEYRDVIYEDLKNAAVFIESIAGIDVKGYTADDVTLSFNENYNIAGLQCCGDTNSFSRAV